MEYRLVLLSVTNGATELSSETVQLINSTRDNPFIDVSIVEDGINETVVATFTSVENYHGSDMRAEIIVDNFGLEARDTIIINVLPENDPPTIAALPDTFVYENDEIWLDFGTYTTDIDDTSLTFTVTALTNEEKLKIGDNAGVFYEPFEFVSFGLFDTVRFLPDPLWSNEHQILVRVADEDTSSSATARVIIIGIEEMTGLDAGDLYYLSATTAGAITKTPPSTAGQAVTRLGEAATATDFCIHIEPPILLS